MRTVETFCGTFVLDDRGRLVGETYCPGRTALVGKAGRRCETCLHWHLRAQYPGWLRDEACPCFECAGMCYGATGDLLFWVPARLPRGGSYLAVRARRRAGRIAGLPARSQRVRLYLFQHVYRGVARLRRRLRHGA